MGGDGHTHHWRSESEVMRRTNFTIVLFLFLCIGCTPAPNNIKEVEIEETELLDATSIFDISVQIEGKMFQLQPSFAMKSQPPSDEFDGFRVELHSRALGTTHSHSFIATISLKQVSDGLGFEEDEYEIDIDISYNPHMAEAVEYTNTIVQTLQADSVLRANGFVITIKRRDNL